MKLLLFILCFIVLIGCSKQEAAAPPPAQGAATSPSPVPLIENLEARASINPKVVVNSTALLKVWVGPKNSLPGQEKDRSYSDVLVIRDGKGRAAKVVPSVAQVDAAVTPTVSACQTISAAGTDFFFSVVPKNVGLLQANAQIQIYYSADCTGIAVNTIGSNTVSVNVTVESMTDYFLGLWNFTLDAFAKFYREILAAFFGILIIVFRKKLKALFHLK